jgi:flagellar hook-associated protein 2
MTFSVSGLVSNLDTSALIDQLMQIERQPQVNLQQTKTGLQKAVDVYRALNTRMQAVQTAAEALSSTTGWQAVKATSSDDKVATVSATAPAVAGSLAFQVTALARVHAVISSPQTLDPSAAGLVTGPISIAAGATTTSIDIGDGSLNAVAAAITASAAGVTASVVHLADGTYSLQIAARTPGAASTFTVAGLDALGTLSTLTQGSDATIAVGDPAGVHYDVASANGTFTGLLPGVTITAKALGAASIAITPDPGAIADKVQALVTAVNDAATYLRSQSSYDATTKTAGALMGDLAATRLGQSLVDAVIEAVGSVGLTAGGAGLSIDRSGAAAFDRAKFLAAYDRNPSQLISVFTRATDPTQNGIAERLRLAAKSATDVVSGSITMAIGSRTTEMKSLDAGIARWDATLALRQAGLKRQFSAMEVALSSLKSQSSWLAGQISKLG